MSLSSVENKTRRIRYVSCPTYTPNGIIISCNVRYSSRCTTYNASIEFVAKPFTDYGWESCFPFFQNSNSRVHNCSGGITLRSSSPNGSNGTIAPFLHRDLSIFCQTVQHQCVRGKASISLLVTPFSSSRKPVDFARVSRFLRACFYDVNIDFLSNCPASMCSGESINFTVGNAVSSSRKPVDFARVGRFLRACFYDINIDFLSNCPASMCSGESINFTVGNAV